MRPTEASLGVSIGGWGDQMDIIKDKKIESSLKYVVVK